MGVNPIDKPISVIADNNFQATIRVVVRGFTGIISGIVIRVNSVLRALCSAVVHGVFFTASNQHKNKNKN